MNCSRLSTNLASSRSTRRIGEDLRATLIFAAVGAITLFSASVALSQGIESGAVQRPEVGYLPYPIWGIKEKYDVQKNLLDWPLAAENANYATIKAADLKRDTYTIAGFARTYRDSGHPQFWGRLIGTSGHDAMSSWLDGEFRKLGMKMLSVRLDVVPQVFPEHWTVGVTSSKGPLALTSASPPVRSTAFPSAATHDLKVSDLPVEYVGLGTAADFRGRDVKGKVAMIYSQPMPGLYTGSADRYDAVVRAINAGAAAILVAVALPGNVTGLALWGQVADSLSNDKEHVSSPVPLFAVGLNEFEALRGLIESDAKPKLSIDLTTQTIPHPQTTEVIGMLPGTTDENIIVIAHMDGYYDGTYDNAQGVASLLALARYYAQVPAAQRKRNIYFVGTPGHHEPHRVGTQWMIKNWQPVFAKTALLINIEHPTDIPAVDIGGILEHYNGQAVPLSWYIGGSDLLKDVGLKTLSEFGVSIVEHAAPGLTDGGKMGPGGPAGYGAPPGEGTDIGHLAPFFQLIGADYPYQSNLENPENIHYPALANVTRAHAKLIDRVNQMRIENLRGHNHPLDMSTLH
jgi:hypothetical protein